MPPAPLPTSILLAIGLSAAAAEPPAADSGQDTGEDTGSKDADLQVCLCAVVDGGTAAVALAGAALLATRRRREAAPPDRNAAVEAVLDSGVLPDDVADALARRPEGILKR